MALTVVALVVLAYFGFWYEGAATANREQVTRQSHEYIRTQQDTMLKKEEAYYATENPAQKCAHLKMIRRTAATIEQDRVPPDTKQFLREHEDECR